MFNHKTHICGTVGVLLLGLAGCGNSGSDYAAKVDLILKPFAGEWTVLTLDRSHKPLSASALRDVTVTVAKDKLTLVEIKGPNTGAGAISVRAVTTEEYILQVDPAKPEGEINFAYASGDYLGQIRPGIYALEENTLKICLGEPGGTRPTQLAPGTKNTLLILERKP